MHTIEKDRFRMKYAVMRHRIEKIAAAGQGEMVPFNYLNNDKVLVPDEI